MPSPLIVGLKGPDLLADERAFLRDAQPVGIIVFARNITQNANRLRRLLDEASEAAGSALALVDQEGGRVQRLRPPLAPNYPPAARYASLGPQGARAAWLAGRLIGADCRSVHLNAPCAPVADVPMADASDVIGDRAFGTDPATVAALAGAFADGLAAAGCLPIAKHVPGHGRATVDSHHDLPRVAAPRTALEADFAPFRALNRLPFAMTAHIVYEAIDSEAPATLSAAVVEAIRNDIGFDGVLMTDDIGMKALSGQPAALSRAALNAGCDLVLHCTGDLYEAAQIAADLPPLAPSTSDRLSRIAPAAPDGADLATLRDEFDGLVGAAALLARDPTA